MIYNFRTPLGVMYHKHALYPFFSSAGLIYLSVCLSFSLCLSLSLSVSRCLSFTELSFNPFPNKPWFLRVCSTRLLKTLWEKEKLLVTSNFSFSHSVFYPCRELSSIFINFKIVVCKLAQFGRVQNLSFGKRLNPQIKQLSIKQKKNQANLSRKKFVKNKTVRN